MFLFQKNQNIGPYTVVFPHKEGKYAETYRVKNIDGKVKFLKLIYNEKLRSFQFDGNGRIVEEEIAKVLNHDNLCSFVDSGKLDYKGNSLTYIVTEYVRGENLDQHIFRNGLPSLQETKLIMKGVLSALNYLHSHKRPIIHNEVTLENIFLDTIGDFNKLKLIDFGASRFMDLKSNAESWQSQNLYYVANERLLNEGSTQSDIFSAGVLLYRLLFGMMPWETELAGKTMGEKVDAIIEKRKSPLSIPNVQMLEIDNNLLKVMVKALAPNPEQRFQSAKEFLDAIEGKIEIGSAPISMTKGNEETNIPSRKEGNGFADVAGMQDIKDFMQKKIINVLKNPERAKKFKIQIPNGMLLYGPPGCGKSFIAEKFAEEAGYNYIFVKSSDLASIYIHGSQEKIGKLFDTARLNAPTIINFDEFEALVPNRSKINNTSESGEVNEFLSQMNNCGKDRIFIIASSNRPDLIDPAIRRKGRLDQMIYIPVPDAEAREGIFKIHMDDRPVAGDINYKRLAELTQNYVASDIAYIVNDAATRAFEDDTDITQELLELVISENNPSISPKDIRYYENLKQTMENKSSENPFNPVGYKIEY